MFRDASGARVCERVRLALCSLLRRRKAMPNEADAPTPLSRPHRAQLRAPTAPASDTATSASDVPFDDERSGVCTSDEGATIAGPAGNTEVPVSATTELKSTLTF